MDERLMPIFQRRSVRSFTDQPVETELIEGLLQAAMAAPTACNSQPWEFIVITRPETFEQIRQKFRFANYNAPLAILVCANVKKAHNSCAKHFWLQDCSAAIENMLIAAPMLGLGAVWIGVHPHPAYEKLIQTLLNMPEQVTPVGLIYIGYPAHTPEPRTQHDPRAVYWEEYEERKRRKKIKNAKYQ
ncbi:MAG: nitroreductase family protein [Anaerolineaceae bacterium]|nr:nitroreductase family protein [Anaerolineaceae bacterium]